MSIRILRCTTGEPRLQALVRELDAELEGRYGEVQRLYSPHNPVDEIETAVLALADGAPVGCGCFRPRAPAVAGGGPGGEPAAAAGGTIELKRMFVRPAARGRRIGQRIVESLEAWARELGHSVAVLETGVLQEEAIALYTRCGYQRTPCFPPYDQLPASVCMRKAL